MKKISTFPCFCKEHLLGKESKMCLFLLIFYYLRYQKRVANKNFASFQGNELLTCGMILGNTVVFGGFVDICTKEVSFIQDLHINWFFLIKMYKENRIASFKCNNLVTFVLIVGGNTRVLWGFGDIWKKHKKVYCYRIYMLNVFEKCL